VVEQRFCKAKAIGSNPLAGFPQLPAPDAKLLRNPGLKTSSPPSNAEPSPDLGFESRRDELLEQILTLIPPSDSPAEPDLRERIGDCIDGFLQRQSKAQTREVSVLLADIRGFTALAETRTAEDVVKILNIFFRRMNSIIQKHGGLIDKYMGDAILAVFGVGDQPEEHALRAVTCAIEMQIEMESVNAENSSHGYPEIFIGIGVNSDIVSAGLLGSELHSEYTVIGNGVNLASRIECHCLRGQVLISAQTLERTHSALTVEAVNRVRVKGKADPVDLFDVIGLAEDPSMTVPRREIRKNLRVELSADVSFQVLQDKRVLPEIHRAKIQDLSSNGMFATSTIELEPLTNIRLVMSLSILSDITSEIYAKITSVRPLEQGFGYGIEFTSIDEESQQVINDLVNRLISGH
jgi:adenylate cyclase